MRMSILKLQTCSDRRPRHETGGGTDAGVDHRMTQAPAVLTGPT